MNKLVLSCSLFVASSVQGFAAVTLQNSDSVSYLGGSTSSHSFSSFDLTGGNAIAVALTFETVGGLSDYSITFGGESLTLGGSVTDTGAGAQTSAVYYLLNPSNQVGDLAISVPPWDRFAASVYSLGNVDGVGDFASDGGTSGGETLSLGYSAGAGDYLVAAAIDNSFGGAGIAPAFSGDNSADAVALIQVSGSTNPEGGTSHYGVPISADGSYTSTFSTGGNSSRNAAAGLVFTASEVQVSAVPEPSGVLALGCLFGASMLTRRRS